VELEKRRLGIGGHAMVSGCPEHWTIQLSNHKLKSALTCTVIVITTHAVPDRRTNDHHGSSTTIRSNKHIAR